MSAREEKTSCVPRRVKRFCPLAFIGEKCKTASQAGMEAVTHLLLLSLPASQGGVGGILSLMCIYSIGKRLPSPRRSDSVSDFPLLFSPRRECSRQQRAHRTYSHPAYKAQRLSPAPGGHIVGKTVGCEVSQTFWDILWW